MGTSRVDPTVCQRFQNVRLLLLLQCARGEGDCVGSKAIYALPSPNPFAWALRSPTAIQECPIVFPIRIANPGSPKPKLSDNLGGDTEAEAVRIPLYGLPSCHTQLTEAEAVR